MADLHTGQVIVITTGEYSDYSVWGSFRVLKDTDLKILEKTWRDNNTCKNERKECEKFYEWLLQEKIIEKIADKELYLGSGQLCLTIRPITTII